MIYEALSCLAGEINEHFKNVLKLNEDKVILSAIVNQDGSIAIQDENKVVITLLNITKELSAKNAPPVHGGQHEATPVHINLSVMLLAYFAAANYSESLRFISFVINFLESKPVFTVSNTPSLNPGIEKMILDMETADAERLSNIWATIGAKYMPSVLYKIRMVTQLTAND